MASLRQNRTEISYSVMHVGKYVKEAISDKTEENQNVTKPKLKKSAINGSSEKLWDIAPLQKNYCICRETMTEFVISQQITEKLMVWI